MDEEKKRNIEKTDRKKKDSLLVKFGLIFAVFTIFTLIFSGVAMYFLQVRTYIAEVEKNVQNFAEYLQVLIKADDLDFAHYQKFMIEHSDDLNIPLDYDGNYFDAMNEYNNLFAEQYPGMIIDDDIAYDDLSYEVKKAHAFYTHEYWLYIFESAAKVFDVAYTYYITPTGEPYHMYYMIDAVRDKKEVDGKEYINLMLDIKEDVNRFPNMWKTWETGEAVHTPDTFNNELGHTYAFYYPLKINDQILGLICVDVELDSVNKGILYNTLILMLYLTAVLVFGVICVLVLIDKKYIHKLEVLDTNIKGYTESKNPEIADSIKKEVTSYDEISSLANQTAAMILELDSYMKDLVSTTKELSETKEQAKNLQTLATRDSLTGIRNKSAYDDELKKLDEDVLCGRDKFGLVIIDLNFLKKINDTYGNDKGNVAIKKLCSLVCNIFNHSPVFRIGGDEFAVILKNGDYDSAEQLIHKFDAEVDMLSHDDNLEPWERVSAAAGVAFFNKKKDKTAEDVFKRADANMYKRKHEMKAARD